MIPIRNAADYRSMLWVAIAIGLVVAQYSDPTLVKYLCPISCYICIACGTIAHNHNHRATFTNQRWNNVFGHILTIFYGYPTLMWVPTHNLNHHKFVNRPGDATATWRYTNKHSLWVALTYPFVSGYHQSFPIKKYIARVKEAKPRLHARIRFQYAFWIGTYVALVALAGFMYHKQQTGLGLYLWFFSVIVPAVCSSTVIMFFNFIQHIHTDAWSEHDHSRNFVGKWFNFLFFNNGYHTVHHDEPALHWSKLPAAHAAIASTIDPKLNERNLASFLFRQYVLTPFAPSLGTKQIGGMPGKDSEPSVVPAPKMKPIVDEPVPAAPIHS